MKRYSNETMDNICVIVIFIVLGLMLTIGLGNFGQRLAQSIEDDSMIEQIRDIEAQELGELQKIRESLKYIENNLGER